MQPLHQATLTQPLQCDLQRLSWAKHNRTTCNGVGNCGSKTGWISTPKRQKDDFEALFKRNFKRKIISAKIEKICWQITFAALMQPFQYDLRSSAAKDNSITHAAAAPSNLDAATTMRSAETELQNTIELRAMASEIAAPKPDLDAKATKKTKRNFKRKITSAKIATIFWQITVAAWMRPLQYDLQSAAAKDNTITHAAAARSNLDAAPFQCNLQPEIQEPHGTTHTDTTTHCKTHRRNNSRTKRPQPHPSHRRGTFHRRLQPLYTEKHKVWCSGFLPKT